MSESNVEDPQGSLVPDSQDIKEPSSVLSNGDEEELSSVPDYGDGLPPELLWIKEGANRVITTIYTYKDPKTNKLKSVTLEISEWSREQGMVEYPIEAEWSIPTKDQLDTYRERGTRIDIRSGRSVLHRATVQNVIIKNHLLELRFPTLSTSSGAPSSLPLPKDKQGALSRAAIQTLGQLHSSVVDLLYMKYIEESALMI